MTTPVAAEPVPAARTPWFVTRAFWACVFLVGLCITLGGSYYAATVPGVYWSSVKVKFLAPISTDNKNPYTTNSSSLAITAGLVGKMVGATTPKAPFNSESVPLAGQGIRDGQEIALSNAGGQWVAIYGNPWLDVQADGARSEIVVARMTAMVESINSTLASLQKDVLAKDRITTRLDPGQIPIYYQKGNRPRAAIAALVLGLVLTGCLVTMGRRTALARSRRKSSPAAAPPLASDEREFATSTPAR